MAVTDEAILKIKDMILSGDLAPGDRLPPEQQLSERLGLDAAPWREAVKALEVIRVLDVRRGDGTYVTSLEPQLLLEAMSFVVDLHDDSSVLEIFAVRRILEPAAAALAAAAMTDETAQALRSEVNAVDASTGVEGLVEHDLVFHKLISETTGNGYLASLIEGLSSRTVRARVWRGLTQENAVARTLTEHHAIVDALANGDAELARARRPCISMASSNGCAKRSEARLDAAAHAVRLGTTAASRRRSRRRRRPIAAAVQHDRGGEVLVQVIDVLDIRASRFPDTRRSRTSTGAGRPRTIRRRRHGGRRTRRTSPLATRSRCSRSRQRHDWRRSEGRCSEPACSICLNITRFATCSPVATGMGAIRGDRGVGQDVVRARRLFHPGEIERGRSAIHSIASATSQRWFASTAIAMSGPTAARAIASRRMSSSTLHRPSA